MELQGKIHHVGNTQQVTATYQKREVVIQTQEQYPQLILIEFAQSKCNLLDGLIIGTEVKIGINLRGREWTNQQGETKYFNSIQGWKIEKLNNVSTVNNYFEKIQPNVQQQAIADFNQEDDGDLPF